MHTREDGHTRGYGETCAYFPSKNKIVGQEKYYM
jgi:hypothetical protein